MNLRKMKRKEKCKFCLTVAEKAKEYIDNKEAYVLVELAIERCWNWISGKHNIAEELYSYLDNEEDGFTIFQETETDEIIIAAWDSVIDAIAYICKSAYVTEKKKYVPEPIELVDDNTITHMMKSFSVCERSNKKPINILYENL